MISELTGSVSDLTSFIPCPSACDRSAWEGLPDEVKTWLIEDGEKTLSKQYPLILMSDFTEFTFTGNRTHYEDKLFERRIMLNSLVLAECVEYKGRFLQGVIDGIYLICEESAWQLPAHNGYVRDAPQEILPDVTRPIVDLFAAETGAILSTAGYLLKDALNDFSPSIMKLIRHNLKKRIFEPYLNEFFWWMGNGEGHLNNWTAWCTQNVLISVFTESGDGRPWCRGRKKRKAVFEKACKSLDYFLDEYGDDGCCNEGAQYYRHAGLTLFNSLEVLNGITGGRFTPVYSEEKIRNIASYILNVHVAGPYYLNFADCSPIAGSCNAREYLFGRRIGDEALMDFAAQDFKEDDDRLIPEEHNLFYRLEAIFNYREIMDHKNEGPVFHPDIYYPSVGLFIARDDRFCLAVKAGCNGDSHNHNDTGSFTIYKDGKPLFIDAGVESYTKKTFSPERYEIWTMQSAYHNLPSFNGIMQMDGKEYRAEDVCVKIKGDDGSDDPEISMDIAEAYPKDTGVSSYVRKVTFCKNECITIKDRAVFTDEDNPVNIVLSLMTYECPVPLMAEPVRASWKIDIGNLGTCYVRGAKEISVEEIPVTDERLGIAWKHSLYRMLVTMDKDQLELKIPFNETAP